MLHSRMPQILATAAFCLILSALGSPVEALPKAKQRWVEARTPHFVLYSDAREEVVADIGLRLERLRHVLSRLPGDLDLDPHRPTYIYVFRDWSSAKPYFPKSLSGGQVGGAFLGRSLANYVLINASPAMDAQSLIHHEYLHAVMHQNFPNLPLWLQEGMAEFYSTFWADAEQAEIGGVNDEYLQVLRADGLMELSAFFAVDEESPEYQDLRSKQRFHAQAWALVHYLMMAQPEHRLQLWSYMKTQRARGWADPLDLGAFSFGLAEMEQRLAGYLQSLQIPQSRLRSANWPAETVVEITPLDRLDILHRLGDLLVHAGGERHRQAARHFDAALKIDPEHAPSLAGNGLLALLDEDAGKAASLFRRAAAVEPSSGAWPFLQAQALMRQALGPRRPVPLDRPPADPLLVVAAELLERSVEKRPAFAEAWIHLGYAAVLGGTEPGRGIEALNAALEMLPGRTEVAYQLLVLYLREGRREEALQLAERTLLIDPDLVWRERARIVLQRSAPATAD